MRLLCGCGVSQPADGVVRIVSINRNGVDG